MFVQVPIACTSIKLLLGQAIELSAHKAPLLLLLQGVQASYCWRFLHREAVQLSADRERNPQALRDVQQICCQANVSGMCHLSAVLPLPVLLLLQLKFCMCDVRQAALKQSHCSPCLVTELDAQLLYKRCFRAFFAIA